MSKYMNLMDLRGNPDHVIECLTGNLLESAVPDYKATGYICLDLDGSLYFRQKGNSYKFSIVDDSKDNFVRDKLYQKYIPMAIPREMDTDDNNIIRLYVVFFAKQDYLDELKLIFTNKLISDLIDRKEIQEDNSLLDLNGKLAGFMNNFYIQDGTNSEIKPIAFAISSNNIPAAAADDAIFHESLKKDGEQLTDGEETKNDEEPIKSYVQLANIPALQHGPKQVWEIYGAKGILTIGIYKDDDGGCLMVAQRFTRGSRNRNNIPALSLGECTISVKSEKAYTSAAIMEYINQENTYLQVWQMYADKEGEFLLKRDKQIGLLGYLSEQSVGNVGENSVIAITLNENSADKMKFLKVGDNLCTSSEYPFFMQEDCTWEKYQNHIFEQKRNTAKTGRYEIVDMNVQLHSLKLKPVAGTLLKKLSGHLFYDDIGDSQQIIRRKNARDNIKNGTSANPHLGMVIGGSDDADTMMAGVLPQTSIPKKRLPALTDAVRSKIFKHEPTRIQKEAIEIALNTPDIAIIQGPPGTGKTTVITAILERLNEMADKKKIQRGQVLITSLQHDAVRNVIERISINSLPTVKFGKRHRDELNEDEYINQWCQELASRIESKNPELHLSEKEIQAEEAFMAYNLNPSSENGLTFLSMALQADLQDVSLIDRITEKQMEYAKKDEAGIFDELLYRIRRLRTRPESFADGGADAADVLLMKLEDEDILDKEEAENKEILLALEEAVDCFGKEPAPEMLFRLEQCKNRLLKRCIPPPRYEIQQRDPEIIELYEAMHRCLERQQSRADKALYKLYNALKNDPDVIHSTLREYSFAFAATAQQSMGRDITNVKGKKPEYDTVIVDEAARVNPGDLMIPLSQAKRRIILVGDHRQLPHMYDEEIFEEMAEENMIDDMDSIKQSMFEVLLHRAKKLTAKDNIKRFITLDNQFRMHPMLGEFISENFYANHDPEEAFSSPLPDQYFVQNMENTPMKWIDMPTSKGNMDSVGHSRVRRCEAETIVERVRLYKERMGEENLSIGIISFYRAQVDYINQLLKKNNLNQGVSVGTVDAFQGMEFDIIFLSIVRTGMSVKESEILYLEKDENNFSEKKEREEYLHRKEAAGRRQYGFLISENRLCVALSRQKRLLVIVGDSSIFHGAVGERMADLYVPALKNFYKLCESEGAVENG